MSTFFTLAKLVGDANQGISIQDKKISFLIAGLGVIGHYRTNIRRWFRQKIDASTTENLIQVRFKYKGKRLSFFMRNKNEGDYLMGGELIRGGYEAPDFEPKHIIDGGANIGMFALQAANQFPNAKIACYEPDSDNFQLLCKNVELNHLQVSTNRLGLWSKDVTLYYHSESSETGFVDENPPGTPIQCVIPDIPQECWLKLDVEGAEYKILPALFEKKQYPRWISMEIHDFNSRGIEMLKLLRKNGYIIEGGNNQSSPCEVISAYRVVEDL